MVRPSSAQNLLSLLADLVAHTPKVMTESPPPQPAGFSLHRLLQARVRVSNTRSSLRKTHIRLAALAIPQPLTILRLLLLKN
jgi:hypothetical protein